MTPLQASVPLSVAMRFLLVCLLSALLVCTMQLVSADSGVPVHYAPAVLSAADTEAAAQGMALIEVRAHTHRQTAQVAGSARSRNDQHNGFTTQCTHWGTARDSQTAHKTTHRNRPLRSFIRWLGDLFLSLSLFRSLFSFSFQPEYYDSVSDGMDEAMIEESSAQVSERMDGQQRDATARGVKPVSRPLLLADRQPRTRPSPVPCLTRSSRRAVSRLPITCTCRAAHAADPASAAVQGVHAVAQGPMDQRTASQTVAIALHCAALHCAALRHCLTAPLLPCLSWLLPAGVRSSVFVEAQRRPLSDGDGCGRGRRSSARLQVQDAAQFVAAQVCLLRSMRVQITLHQQHQRLLQQAIHCFVQQTIVHRAQRSPVPPCRFLQAHNFIRLKYPASFLSKVFECKRSVQLQLQACPTFGHAQRIDRESEAPRRLQIERATRARSLSASRPLYMCACELELELGNRS